MKQGPVLPCLILVCLLSLASLRGSAQVAASEATSARKIPVQSDPDGEAAWAQLVENLGPSNQGSTTSAAGTLAKADRTRTFYQSHKNNTHVDEARKLEALFLLDAVAEGDAASAPRMQAAVQALRGDASLPASQRAIVVGTYEFQMARERIHSEADMFREYGLVARRLMKEFPDQPQGYVSLLTQSTQREPRVARAMAQEVADSSGPASARTQAKRLVNRLDLLGQPVDVPFAETLTSGANAQWQKGKPGIIYFWATWSPGSINLGEMLARRNLAGANVIGVCLDVDLASAQSFASGHKLPGRLVYIPRGLEGDLSERLGAFEAPTVYFTEGSGVFTDVRGLENVEAKLASFGL